MSQYRPKWFNRGKATGSLPGSGKLSKAYSALAPLYRDAPGLVKLTGKVRQKKSFLLSGLFARLLKFFKRG